SSLDLLLLTVFVVAQRLEIDAAGENFCTAGERAHRDRRAVLVAVAFELNRRAFGGAAGEEVKICAAARARLFVVVRLHADELHALAEFAFLARTRRRAEPGNRVEIRLGR